MAIESGDPTSQWRCCGALAAASAGLAAILVVKFVFSRLQRMGLTAKLRDAVEKERKQRDESIDLAARQSKETPEDLRLQIHDLTIEELLDGLRSGNYTAVDVLHTYQFFAVQAHERTNCVTRFIVDAEDRARQLDEQLKRDADFAKDKLLFGLPISLKESTVVKGHRVTRGYASVLLQNDPSDETGLCVDLLLRHGAVPFVRTNVPQMLFSFGCSNPIYGRTSNPFSKALTAGGSSGGEAALIKMRGSICGIGSDVGGSIRFPCHFCGIFGFKPSEKRITQLGCVGSVPGRQMICASAGPMTNSVAAIEIIMRVWLYDRQYLRMRDPYVFYQPWTPVAQDTKLTIGYYDSFDWFPTAPSCARAVRLAVDKLRGRGHALVPFDMPEPGKGIQLFVATGTVDGGKYFMDNLAEDLWEKDHEKIYRLMSIPQRLRAAMLPLIGSARMQSFFARLPLSTSDLRQVYVDVANYRRQVVGAWRAAGLDALVCPVQASVAMPHDLPMRATGTVIYSAIFNPLDFCAGTLPVTEVSQQDVDNFCATYNTSVDEWAQIMGQVNGTKDSIGLPVNVQIVTLPFEEEMCVFLMKEIEDLIG